MQDGSYPRGIQKGCSILADAINLSQKGISQAKEQIDKNLDRMRQVIHEKTAPRTAPRPGEVQSPRARVQSPRARARRKAPPEAKPHGIAAQPSGCCGGQWRYDTGLLQRTR